MSEQPADSRRPARAPRTTPRRCACCATASIDLEGRLLDASQRDARRRDPHSTTLVAECVYKPVAGERPLWDFPDGTLAGREIVGVPGLRGHRLAASSRRRCCATGPFGPGHGASSGSTATRRSTWPRSSAATTRRCAGWRSSTRSSTTPTARAGTSSRCPTATCTASTTASASPSSPKLRTLLWRWAGKPLPDEARRGAGAAGATSSRGDLGEQLHEHLTRREVRCTQQRVAELLRTGRHPEPSGEWPALPWPPF